MKKVLITGATGSTGRNAIKKLLELKVPVRALVHKKDARSDQLSGQGVEIVEGDLSDFDSVSAALKEIGGAYFMYPIQVAGILEGTAFFAQAAIDEGVGFIVNMSQMAARRVAKSHASQGHWIAEYVRPVGNPGRAYTAYILCRVADVRSQVYQTTESADFAVRRGALCSGRG